MNNVRPANPVILSGTPRRIWSPRAKPDPSRSTAQDDKRAIFGLWAFACVALLYATTTLASPKPAVADKYLDLTITYCNYAKSIWHDAPAGDVGGYWGDGLAATPDKNGNGNVRGMVNTMLGYAMLIHAMDEGWLTQDQVHMSRDELLKYVKLNLAFLNAHHTSANPPMNPQWGMSWQSPLWLGAAGPAVLLVWKDLPDDLKTNFAKICAVEADRIVAKPPKDYKPGDTGAEENAWDEHAPAVALAIDPKNPHADAWMKALKSYALNVYSLPSEKGKVDGVITANLFADYTLENHGFFHPDYVQVSGQHLGESLVFLQMGDKLNGTNFAEEFKPFAMHNLKEVWEHVMLPLLQPDGQFAFPNGTDWTIHTSIEPAYLACISTLVHDPVAIDAETHHANNALRRREVSPLGRIYGDTNMEWWWEPLLIKRCANAILEHEYRDAEASHEQPKLAAGAFVWNDAKVFAYRNDEYFVSVAWGAKHMATFYPQYATDQMTLPIEGIIPKDVESLIDQKAVGDAHVAMLRCKNGKSLYCICLPHSVLWISPAAGFRALGVENDKFAGGKRHIFGASIDKEIPTLADSKSEIASNWLSIDDRLGLVIGGAGFEYTSPKSFNRKSAAFDTITPTANAATWQMIRNITHDQLQKLVSDGSSNINGDRTSITVRDGANGKLYTIEADQTGKTITIESKP